MAHTYQYPRPSVTVDAIIVAKPQSKEDVPRLLLVERKHPPCQGQWALPGGFVDENEPLDKAAARELQEETSVNPSDIDKFLQVGAFGDPGRDPRGWCVTVAYAAVVPTTALGVKAADDAKDARWFDIAGLPQLAFDHKLVVRTAFQRLQQELELDRCKSQQGGSAGDQPQLLDYLPAAIDGLQGPWTPPTQ